MRIVFIAAMLAATPPAFAADPFAGDWSGKGATRGRDDRFAIEAHIYDDSSAKASYDGVGGGVAYHCDGDLLAMGGRGAQTRLFREKIAHGPCLGGAAVKLVRVGASARWTWAGADGAKAVTAAAAFSRR